jgi:colicin import membrane protein
MPGQHTGAVFFSVALHVAILVALTLSFHWPLSVRVASAPAPIQGFTVDPSVLKAEQQRKEQEIQRKQKEERDKREAAEQKQREKEAADKRERDRLAEQQRVKEQQDREKAEAAKAAEKAAQEKAAKAAQEKAAQEAREKQAKADAARKQKEAKEQAQLDAETQKEAAQEAARMAAERSGVMDEYIRQIQAKIALNWNQPLSAKPGLECVINVIQLPTGDVFKATVDNNRCNGDDAVKRSIEAAVQRASPLPKPPTQAVFERNLIVTFRPDVQQ